MSRAVRTISAGAIFLVLTACTSTTIKSSWVDPKAEPIHFTKTLAVFMSANETTRQTAEEQLVQQIAPAQAVASYTIIPAAVLRDTEQAKRQVKQAGFDGAVVMRVTDKRQELSDESGTADAQYEEYWGYHAWGWPTVYDPGNLHKDTIVTVETHVYSLTEDKLIWSGVSETFNLNDTARMVDEVTVEVANELKKHGLLTTPK